MLISRTGQYAIQATILIAVQPSGQRMLNRDMAAILDIPLPYLAKVLQLLQRGGLLDSLRGRRGGFLLRPEARQATLQEILALTESRTPAHECILGLRACEAGRPCPLHVDWQPVRDCFLRMLRTHTVEALAEAVHSGRHRLTDLPGALTVPRNTQPATEPGTIACSP